MRNSFLKFGGCWTLQECIVLLTSLRGIMFLNYDADLLMNNNASKLATLILLISLFGLVFETIGDYQKNIFYNNKKSEAKRS